VAAYRYSGFTRPSVGFCIAFILMINVVTQVLKPCSSGNR
jgi:hypothetical protein